MKALRHGAISARQRVNRLPACFGLPFPFRRSLSGPSLLAQFRGALPHCVQLCLAEGACVRVIIFRHSTASLVWGSSRCGCLRGTYGDRSRVSGDHGVSTLPATVVLRAIFIGPSKTPQK